MPDQQRSFSRRSGDGLIVVLNSVNYSLSSLNYPAMYTLLFLLLAAVAIYLIVNGVQKKRSTNLYLGAGVGIITLLFSWFLGFWGEKLWFDHLGYNDRFWTVFLTRIGLFAGLFIAGGLVMILFTMKMGRENRLVRGVSVLTGALITGLWWSSQWDMVLRFAHRVDTSLTDPILGKDTGFYLFTYPFLHTLYLNLLVLAVIAFGASILGYRYLQMKRGEEGSSGENKLPGSIYLSLAVIFIILGFGRFVARFGLMYSDYGFVTGPGWTDVKVRLPMITVTGIFSLLAGAGLLLSVIRPGVPRLWRARRKSSEESYLYTVSGVFVGVWALFLWVVPLLFQWLKVEPNEITVEKPYIENNIRFTRSGFHLDKVEEFEYDVSEDIERSMMEEHSALLSNIRLWDYRALDAVYKQFQEIRLYYEFLDVDIDRYTIDNQYRQVMVSAREMQPSNLPPNSQTFVNRHFKYTHGYGAVLNLVNEFTEEGLPRLLIKDIPPVSLPGHLEIERPEIYYGQLTDHFVVVNSSEEEFDYPSGDQNIYAHYEGSGGVQITGLWRKFLYGYRYGGTRLFFSGYPTDQSRIMLHRQISERVRRLTPFLQFDEDPYIVIAEGKMYWIMDAYTTSRYYPYSEPFSSFETTDGVMSRAGVRLHGENYIRNSVKIVVDAYSGEVDFYIFEEEDPLVRVYDRIFPGLLKSSDEMPESLYRHVRYPVDMLLVQGLVYGKYHMTDPTVFYNQEDLWVRATEKYYNNVQPVEPYYIMWVPPGSDEMEFVLILPFTPKNKQVMIGWIAGMSDQEDYGRFLAYQFPKEKRILGTQQVETKIDQDSYLSGQLSLWDQRGSNVIRGNVLAIPVARTILYVEPIYLMSETSAYPELRLVAVMHNDNLSYAETFEEALRGLFTGTGPGPEGEPGLTGMETTRELIDRANQAFENYLENMQQKQFGEAGNNLQELEDLLNQLATGSEEN